MKFHEFWRAISPFIVGLLAYAGATYFLRPKTVIAPSLIGYTVPEGVAIASRHNIAIQIIDRVERNDIADNSITDQLPQAQQQIKHGQTMYITTSYLPPLPTAPDLLNATIDTVYAHAHVIGIPVELHYVPHTYQEGKICAQATSAGKPYNDNVILVYCAAPKAPHYCLGNVYGSTYAELKQFLLLNGLMHADDVDAISCTNCTIVDQRPVAGSFVDFTKTVILDLKLKHEVSCTQKPVCCTYTGIKLCIT